MIEEKNGNELEYTIALLGDTSVGKTCLFKKLTTGVFIEKNISTIGVDKKSLNLEIEVNENQTLVKKLVNISLVDTAGQERYRSITKSYFKSSDGIILLYDLTNKETFTHVENWIKNIYDAIGKTNSPFPILLLGNKLDLIENNGKEREVGTEDGEKKCEEHNITWGGECSVKDFTLDKFKKIMQDFVCNVYNKIGKKSKNQHTKMIGKAKKKNKSCTCV